MAKNYEDARYYAITGIGWGKGFTADEAVDNYFEIQRRNFRQTREEIEKLAWGSVWLVPEGTEGFVAGMGLHWTFADGGQVEASEDQIVGRVGKAPDGWA